MDAPSGALPTKPMTGGPPQMFMEYLTPPVIVQSMEVKGCPVMGLIPWTSNCRLFQSNDYGSRRQSRPPKQAHTGGHLQKPPLFTEDYRHHNFILDKPFIYVSILHLR